MHFLITGGTGFIGTHLVPHLIAQGNQVTVVTRNVAKAEMILGSHVSYLSDLANVSTFDDVDVIINLAGEPIADKRWTARQKGIICDSRWSITQQLVDVCHASQSPPALFISGSAIGVYGRQGAEPIDESFAGFHSEFSRDVCHQWEQIALAATSEHTRVCILRIGVVLGAHGGAMAKMLLPFRLGLGGPVGTGKQFLSWIHLDDMVKAISFLATTPDTQGIYNLTAPHPVTSKQFASALGKRLSRPACLPVPSFMLKLLMGESSDLLLYGQNVIPTRLMNSGYTFIYPTLENAFAAMPLTP